MARVLVDQFITSYARPPELIVLDFDDTEDPVHGEQEQARYDGYYGGYCFLPLHLYEGLSGRLITTIFKAKRFTGTQRLSVVGADCSWGREGIATKIRYAFGISHQRFPRRPMPDAMPYGQHTRR